MRFHLSQMKPFFHPLGQKLSHQLSCQTTKPRRHAIVSVVATARAEAAPTKSHALDVESLKVTASISADMASTLRDVRFWHKADIEWPTPAAANSYGSFRFLAFKER
ncbi:MAG: hypothetical protein WCD26_25145 [Pseudolabrys sp.]